jgi:hypothetical protein
MTSTVPLGPEAKGRLRKPKLIINKKQGPKASYHIYFFTFFQDQDQVLKERKDFHSRRVSVLKERQSDVTEPYGIPKQLNFCRKTNNVPSFIWLLLFIFKIPNNTSV